MIWDALIKTYDNNIDRCKDIAPIAHTKIKANIGILVSPYGDFMLASEVNNITTIIPCTARSDGRSCNAAPHPIHDNLSYVGLIDGYESRHDTYMQQLYNYAYGADVEYAKAIYNYLRRDTILDDIDYILKNTKVKNINALNVVFAVYGIKYDTIDNAWTRYHIAQLPKNGICMVTGQPDYIPDTYPSGIRYPGDLAHLIMSNAAQKVDSKYCKRGLKMGYIASQKCCHVLQVLLERDKNYLNDSDAKIMHTVINPIIKK